MVHLVTGFAGQAHVASEDDGSKQAAIVGTGRYVANVGSEFEATIKSNNLVRIADGDLFNQGRHIRIPTNSYEEVTISNGSQGVNRNDLIVMRYEKNTSNGIETAALKVIKGTAGSTAKDPEYTQGDILAGDYVDEFPLYRVKITGLSITAVEPMFEILLPMAEMYSRLNGNYIEYNYPSIICQDAGQVTGDVIAISETGIYLIWASAKNNGTSKSGFTELSVIANGIMYPLDTVSHEGNQVICTGIFMGKLQSGQTVYHRVFQNGGYAETIADRRLRMIKLK